MADLTIFSVRKNLTALYLTLGFMVSVSAQAFAQQAALDEVVVTARKRAETLSAAPLAVTAVAGTSMDKVGITNLEQLSSMVPGLQVGRAAQTSSIFIRGIGSGINKAFEQSVGMYVDGVYQPRSRQFTQTLVDLHQLEVLHGPQTVLFGKNTIAGAIIVETANPEPGEEFDGSVTFDYEPQWAGMRGTGVFSGSLSDSFAVRLAVRYQESDGYVSNRLRGDDEQEKQDTVARLTLAWDATQNVSVLAKLANTKMDANGVEAANPVVDPSLLGDFLAGANSLTLTNVMGTIAALSVPGYQPSVDSTSHDSWVGNLNFYPTDVEETESSNAQVRINWDPGDWSITALTAWSDFSFEQNHDVDFQPGNVAHNFDGEEIDQFSQELRFASDLNERINFIVGLYFERQNLLAFNDVFLDGMLGGVFGTLPADALNPAYPPGLTLSDIGINSLWNGLVLAPGTPLESVELDTIVRSPRFDQTARTTAAFGEITFDIADNWILDVGARYSKHEKDVLKQASLGAGEPGSHVTAVNPDGSLTGNLDPLSSAFLVAVWGGALSTWPHEQDLERDESHFDPTVRLRWNLGENTMTYLSYSEGHKSGGFNFNPDTANPDGTPAAGTEYEDEQARGWELGLKSTISGGRARIGAAIFGTEVKNLQVTSFNGTNFVVGNAAEVSISGAEFDTQIAVTEVWEIGGSLAYLNHKYDSFPDAPCQIGQIADGCVSQDLSGQRGAFTPEWSGTAYAQFDTDISNSLRLVGNIRLSYKDEFFLDGDLDPNLIQEAYTKVNARIGLISQGGSWEVSLYGRNLTDETTYTFGVDSPLSAGIFAAWIEEPRTYGIQLRYMF